MCWNARRVTPPAFPKPGDGCWEDVAHSICMTCATATAAYKPYNLTSYHDVSILGTPDPTLFSLFSLPGFSLGLIRRTISACSRTMARYIDALSSGSWPRNGGQNMLRMHESNPALHVHRLAEADVCLYICTLPFMFNAPVQGACLKRFPRPIIRPLLSATSNVFHMNERPGRLSARDRIYLAVKVARAAVTIHDDNDSWHRPATTPPAT